MLNDLATTHQQARAIGAADGRQKRWKNKVPSMVVIIASTSFHPVRTSASMQKIAKGGGVMVAAMSEKIMSCP